MRECGMLLPIASLPSRYGIGSFSREAYEFIDILKEAGQSYWQILPLGPTGFGDSPYQSFSAFAGNPYFIDLERLTEEGILTKEECLEVDFGEDQGDIDYKKIYEGRFPLLKKAYQRWKKKLGTDREVHQLAEQLLREETREYCFYMAVKDAFGSGSWDTWDQDIRMRQEKALKQYRKELSDEIGYYEFQQIKFEEQWKALKEYAHAKGIRIIGDIPIYVAFDSADSWSRPELFQLDERNLPVAVAGCPPDAFSATGQLWGNPLYDWEYHKKTGYQWWIRRMEYSLELYDVVRVDHFRGFESYYAIPYGDKTAEKGHWEKGPDLELFSQLKKHRRVKKLPIIAEDLGLLTPPVRKLLRASGFPGMKVLEFAFDSGEDSDYLPHKYGKNCVVYTGTHDNDTVKGWFSSLNRHDRAFLLEYLDCQHGRRKEINWSMIRAALSSPADLAVIPVQDYLGLGSEARINEPSTIGKNWKWRMEQEAFTPELIEKCRRMAEIYGRAKRTGKK